MSNTVSPNASVHSPADDPAIEANRQAMLQQNGALVQLEAESAKEFSNAIHVVSGGALAVSLTFIKDINSSPTCVEYLYVAWIGFALALLTIIVASLVSIKGLVEQRKINEQYYGSTDDKGPRVNKIANLAEWGNRVAVVSFSVGIVSLIGFVLINYPAKPGIRTQTQTTLHSIGSKDTSSLHR